MGCTTLFPDNLVGDFRQSFCRTDADKDRNSGMLEDALAEFTCDLFKIIALWFTLIWDTNID